MKSLGKYNCLIAEERLCKYLLVSGNYFHLKSFSPSPFVLDSNQQHRWQYKKKVTTYNHCFNTSTLYLVFHRIRFNG